MRILYVDEKNANKRIDRYLSAVMPEVPFSLIQKTFRKKTSRLTESG
jgi:hypothetical protein